MSVMIACFCRNTCSSLSVYTLPLNYFSMKIRYLMFYEPQLLCLHYEMEVVLLLPSNTGRNLVHQAFEWKWPHRFEYTAWFCFPEGLLLEVLFTFLSFNNYYYLVNGFSPHEAIWNINSRPDVSGTFITLRYRCSNQSIS